MPADWQLLCSAQLSSNYRFTVPHRIRGHITGEDYFGDQVAFWGYEPETGFGVMANWEHPATGGYGKAPLEGGFQITLNSEVRRAGFNDIEFNDLVIFLAHSNLLEGEKRSVYFSKEQTVCDLLKNYDELRECGDQPIS